MAIERRQSYAEQVRAILHERIKDGSYTLAGRLPSEDDLAREFGVSRATVRTALASLSADGLLTRKQGHGTFINTGAIEVNTQISTVWEFTRLIADSGRKPSIRLRQVESRSANENEAKALHCKPGETVLVLTRLFLADGQPVIVSRNSIPTALLTGRPDGEGAILPVIEFVRQYCDQSIADAIADLSAVAAEEQTAGLLGVAPGTPLLHIAEVFYSDSGRPLVYGDNCFYDRYLRLRLLHSCNDLQIT